ncbi:MAG: DUF669 domain-containing protein [Actinobacteria bacterium]|nr:DUF669 domain-containing protein [Actinomycetota bacterium]
MTSIDFNALMQEAGEGFQPVPPGPYTIQVHKTEATTSSTQKPMIRAQLRIMGGPHDGRILFDQYTLTAGNPNALGFFFDTMAALGLDRQYFAANPPMQTVAQALLGRQANVQVAMKVYQGIDRNDVKSYRPVQGGMPPAQVPVAGVPQMGGAMPMAPQGDVPQMPQQPQQPQAPQPQQAPPQQYAPQPQQMPQQMPQMPQSEPPQQYAPQPQQEYQQQPQQMPVPPAQQQGQPQPQQTWQPSGPPPGAEQPVPPPPGVVPPMPQVPDQQQRSI